METRQCRLSLIREEPLLRNCVCSVRKSRIPLPARLHSAQSGVWFQQLGFIREKLQETSTTGGFLLSLSPAGMMECAEQRAAAALTFPNQSSLTERDAAGKRTVRVTLMTRSSAELRVDRTLLRRSKTVSETPPLKNTNYKMKSFKPSSRVR